MDWLRAGAARRMGELAPDGAGTHDPTDIRAQRDLYGVDTQQELLGALATLPPRQRAVIVLRYWKTCPKPRWLRFLAARPAAFAPGFRVSHGTSSATDAHGFFDYGDYAQGRLPVAPVLSGLVRQLRQHRHQPGWEAAPAGSLQRLGLPPVTHPPP